ncbi:MAG TPA: DUF2723 domain-containing protein [candidate division Zixibacteria bacterium]|nr:DUF2723 domain-containing protein [candidate division Zixibacteria bacterium]
MNSINFADNDIVKFDRINAIIASSVFAVSFVVYYLTMAPTFSFWDCGEFVACSYILGIPHPPGSPLYILVGRIFTIFPLAADIAARINLLSVLTSAFTATFAYLTIVRLIRFWFDNPTDRYNRIITYVGGFTGALFVAFSSTNWANSVEAEVYAPAMALMLAIYWLTLKYFDRQGTISGSRAMLLALFLAVLGIGIHLTLFAIVPALGLYFILRKKATDRHWMLVSVFFLLELYFIFRLSSQPDEVPFYLTVLIVLIIFLFHLLQFKKASRTAAVSLGLFLVALYPFYFVLLDNLMKRFGDKGLSPSVKSLGDIQIGWIGLVGLVIWGVYLLIRHYGRKGKSGTEPKQEYIIAIYSLAPIVLIGLGEFFNAFDPYSAFKVLTVILLAILFGFMRRYINWPIAAALGGISLIMLGFWPFVYGLGFGTVAVILMGSYLKEKSWKTALAIILLAVIGYSVHGYIPIRSALNPTIDESNPSESFSAMVGYLERKQYGAESMSSRMFKRRGEWENQFGDYRRMGFWRFFKEQYGFNGSLFFITFILGLFGIWEMIRRKPALGLPFLIMVLICTVGIVLYMNFADGTRQHPLTGHDYLEVRNRDYFYTAGFIFFGMAIGLGIAGLMVLLRDSFKNSSPTIRRSVFGLSSLLVLMPLAPLSTNYFINDRSRNYMPYDYAHNLLKPCEKDAIFITNGDNDTFPVWCLQEVYGIRKDVKTVNLSLANAPWYIKQLREHHGVPIGWSDAEVDRLRPYQTKEGKVYRLQDQVIDEIITQNKNRRPIHISVTTPSGNRIFMGKPLDSNLVLEGMVYRYTPDKGFNQIDYEKSLRMYEEEYQYRGIADSTVYKDEATRRIVNNYSQGILWLADTLRRAGDFVGAFERIKKGLKVLPESHDLYGYGAQLLADQGRFDTLEMFVEQAKTDRKAELYMQWGYSAKYRNNMDEAVRVFEKVFNRYPDYQEGFRTLAAIYYRQKKIVKLKEILSIWLTNHPGDNEVKQALADIQKFETQIDTSGGGN